MLKINIDDPELVNLDDYGSFYEYKGTPLTGTIYEAYENGQIMAEQCFLNGDLEGVSKEWDAEGNLLLEEHYQKGKLHGTHKLWDGERLLAAILFEEGEAVEYEKWNDKGDLIQKKYPTSETYFWNEKGKLEKFTAIVKQPTYHQLSQTFFDSGQLKTEEIDGKIVGDAQLGFHEQQKEWNEVGDLLKFSQVQFGSDKQNSAYCIRFEIHRTFHQKTEQTSKITSEKVLTVFSASLAGNEHQCTEERYFNLSGEIVTYQQHYHLNLKRNGKSKNIEKEKALCLKWHKRNPYKFDFLK